MMNLITQEKTNKNNQLNGLIYTITLLTFLIVPQSFSRPISQSHSLENIRETAKNFLTQQHTTADQADIQVTLGKIDPRIQLPQCNSPLEAFYHNKIKTSEKQR